MHFMKKEMVFDGEYINHGREFEFILDRESFGKLGSECECLLQHFGVFRAWIAGYPLSITCSKISNVEVCLDASGHIQMIASKLDISKLADKFLQLSGVASSLEEAIDHIHLEPRFMDSSDIVTDIIFTLSDTLAQKK